MFMQKQSRDNMKLKLRILILISAILLLVSSSIFVYALLKEEKTYDELKFNLGKVNVSITGELADDYIYPGKNLILTPYKLSNASTINIDLKVTIEIVFIDSNNNEIPITNDEYEETSLIKLNNEQIEGNTYIINNVDPSISELIIIDELTLDGTKVKNEYSEMTLRIKISFQAKQSDHATWKDLE